MKSKTYKGNGGRVFELLEFRFLLNEKERISPECETSSFSIFFPLSISKSPLSQECQEGMRMVSEKWVKQQQKRKNDESTRCTWANIFHIPHRKAVHLIKATGQESQRVKRIVVTSEYSILSITSLSTLKGPLVFTPPWDVGECYCYCCINLGKGDQQTHHGSRTMPLAERTIRSITRLYEMKHFANSLSKYYSTREGGKKKEDEESITNTQEQSTTNVLFLCMWQAI